jgi:hypothetical protein
MFGRPGPGEAGGVNAPAETVCAEVIVTLGKLSLERLSHVDPPVGAAVKQPAEIISNVVIENLVTDYSPLDYFVLHCTSDAAC